MKKILSVITFLFFIVTFCQEKLEVEYEFRNEFDITNINDKKKIQLYKNSNENKLYFELLSSEEESIFTRLEKIDNSQNRTGTSISFMNGPGGDFYKDLLNKSTISKINYKGKKLLIHDSIKTKNWILHKDKEKILGFEIKKATLKESENIYIEAWYAPSLTIKNGPSNYDGLPGLILKLIINNKEDNRVNKQIYIAEKVKISDKINIDKPSKGDYLSQSDFDKLVKEDEEKFTKMFTESEYNK